MSLDAEEEEGRWEMVSLGFKIPLGILFNVLEDFRGSFFFFLSALHVMGVSSFGQPSIGVEHFNLGHEGPGLLLIS